MLNIAPTSQEFELPTNPVRFGRAAVLTVAWRPMPGDAHEKMRSTRAMGIIGDRRTGIIDQLGDLARQAVVYKGVMF